MTVFSNSPRRLKGGIVPLDTESGTIQRVIALQYNPDMLTRTLQLQGVDAPGESLRSRIRRPDC
jgi:hypothetical protein